MNLNRLLPLICFLSCGHFVSSVVAQPVSVQPVSTQTVQYNRDVRPILADKCFRCHGPDAAARKVELRLDEAESAKADRGGYSVITPGKPEQSELIRRVTSTDNDLRMPPHDSGSQLRSAEIEILRRWIRSGAEYQPHWSFIPPRRPAMPEVSRSDWPRNAIDHFVLARLDREGMRPAAEAAASTLIRRVTLDLTGLPPTLDEIDSFDREVAQNPELAWQRLIDRLLASPRYGERMTQVWLDAARYADTNGYFTDNDRSMWPWRDWVIKAFNQNMPYDQFTIEQLAGDLLPGSTIEQKVATGFNRNHMVNNETGIVEEEFRVEYVVDRVETTATVWMGLTLGCARCHDHKYDPISQSDYYRFFAFFNNVPERGLSGSSGNSAPILNVPTAELQTALDNSRLSVATAEREFASVNQKLDQAQTEWEKTAVAQLRPPIKTRPTARYALDEADSQLVTSGSLKFAPGILGNAARFDGDAYVSVPESVDFDRSSAFSIGVWIRPESAGCVISKMDDAADMRGFDVTLRKGKALVNLVHRWNSNAIQVATVSSIPGHQWQHLAVTYDGSSTAKGVRVYLDGDLQTVTVNHDSLSGTIRNEQPLRIGRRQASAPFEGLIDEVQLYDSQLEPGEVQHLAAEQLVRGVLSQSPSDRSDELKRKLRALFLRSHADPKLVSSSEQLDRLRQGAARLAADIPTTMVMQESKTPRGAFVLDRGQHDQKGEEVTANVLEFLAPGQAVNATRLEMAKWLVDPGHPLTARVTVNRLWQQLFGSGLVSTVDDFGTQGDWPSHPDLLDWLATELTASGWNLKHVLRLMVSSATYRQSAIISSDDLHNDHQNRLLARGSRFRMDAEMLRDQALAISGLLVEKPGGPSVHPYQPSGLWADVAYDADLIYPLSSGPSLHRRSLYTFWKRQAPPPNMLVFDAPTRETCTVQRSRTNTPLQALALMNDPTFVEAARKLAERMMTESNHTASDRVALAFRLATSRRPSQDETRILLDLFTAQTDEFSKNRNDARRLLTVGQSSRDESLDAVELAAWTTIASLILCLDETITKP